MSEEEASVARMEEGGCGRWPGLRALLHQSYGSDISSKHPA